MAAILSRTQCVNTRKRLIGSLVYSTINNNEIVSHSWNSGNGLTIYFSVLLSLQWHEWGSWCLKSPVRLACLFNRFFMLTSKDISKLRSYWENEPPLMVLVIRQLNSWCHNDVIKRKHFPRYWPFLRGIMRSLVDSPHKGQWRGALMFSLTCAWKKTKQKRPRKQSRFCWFETS